jgi:hypothetical protein
MNVCRGLTANLAVAVVSYPCPTYVPLEIIEKNQFVKTCLVERRVYIKAIIRLNIQGVKCGVCPVIPTVLGVISQARVYYQVVDGGVTLPLDTVTVRWVNGTIRT